jgi:hypothetical protein
MEAIKPTSKIEFKLMLKEDWHKAKQELMFWKENFVVCDTCDKRIRGRHFIHGLLEKNVEFFIMCPKCHIDYGNGLGEGKGSLYTRLYSGKWVLSYGFKS